MTTSQRIEAQGCLTRMFVLCAAALISPSDVAIVALAALALINAVTYPWSSTRISKTPKVEPSADLRSAASVTRQMFVALVDEGYSEAQALTLVHGVLTSGIKRGKGQP
jgi:hypothetical protein